MTATSLPEAAYLAALASLPDVGPARLAALLARGRPSDVLLELAADRLVADAALAAACGRRDPRPLLATWVAAAAALDVAAGWEAHVRAGVRVLAPGDDGWPARFTGDPEPPSVLFACGDPAVAEARHTVAVVGTRRCTRYGWDVAHRFGRELAAAGVVVVSGLARGIDAAAHRGALDAADALTPAAPVAPPVGVVGTGLDVVYPRQAKALWEEVGRQGVLLSEAPLGTPPARWRFPARNRLIAALADAVVVVESAGSGGALHTVDEALARDVPVLAVPGPVTSPASVGTNRLLRDVAAPACDTADVLVALGLDVAAPPAAADGAAAAAACLDDDEQAVADAVGWTPASLDDVASRAGLPLGAAAAALGRLERAGVVRLAGPTSWVRADGRAERGGAVTR